jgi:hypothetical protein
MASVQERRYRRLLAVYPPAGPAPDGRDLESLTALPGGHLAAVGTIYGPTTFGRMRRIVYVCPVGRPAH